MNVANGGEVGIKVGWCLKQQQFILSVLEARNLKLRCCYSPSEGCTQDTTILFCVLLASDGFPRSLVFRGQ
jgi:hypothetical protein